MQNTLSEEYCEVFQKLLSSQFILCVWKSFRESGNVSEGKVTKTTFVREMIKQLKNYVKAREFSYTCNQFFLQLSPEQFLLYVDRVRDEFKDILKRKADEAKARNEGTNPPLIKGDKDAAFDNWFKQHYDSPFDKWFKQNYECSTERMFKTNFEHLSEKWLKTNNLIVIFEKGLFEKWVQPKFEYLFEKIYERFSLETDDKVEIQDVVLSLAVLARLELDPKLDLIFQLSDVDEDGCLSIDDIQQMIKRIEKNFTRETSLITSDSQSLQHELAFRRAMRKFSWSTLKMDKQVDIKNDELGLIEGKHFLQSLKQNKSLYESFLPSQLLLYDVLLTDQSEREYNINEQENGTKFSDEPKKEEVTFDGFRKEIHASLRNNYKDKFSKMYLQEHKGQVRYPGKFEVGLVGSTMKKIPRLEKFEEKKEPKKEKEDNQLQQQKSNNIDVHLRRIRDMNDQRQQWKLTFNSNDHQK